MGVVHWEERGFWVEEKYKREGEKERKRHKRDGTVIEYGISIDNEAIGNRKSSQKGKGRERESWKSTALKK